MAAATLASVLQQLRTIASAKAYEERSDRELLELFLAQREETAFAALVKRHGPMVLQLCRRILGNEHDAEDVFQATFLLLARKAGSISKPESLAGWLHGVAHRLALEAKTQGTRRQSYERKAADMRGKSDNSDETWHDLQETLDEALRQVQEKYRLPLLLCYLQGKTQEEAARQLGCPLGTLRSRLARGRERLKEVLERQGVCLSAGALSAGLAKSAASAAVPPLLVHATTRAALSYAAGKTAAALVSARAATLVEAGLKAMLTAQIKIVTMVLLAVGTLGLGAGGFATRLVAGLPQATAKALEATPPPKTRPVGDTHPQPRSQVSAAEPTRDEITLRGRVLGIDGKPLGGAKLLLLGQTGKPVDLGRSAVDGHFTVGVPKDLKGRYLVAQANHAGVDFVELRNLDPSAPIELRLVKDHAIRGRILDTQGTPVVGARVAVSNLNVYDNNSLEQFLAEWKKRRENAGLPVAVKQLWHNGGSFLETLTGADGRYTLAGTGAERFVCIHLSGPGIADAEFYVVNREGFDPKPYNDATRKNVPKGFERFWTPKYLLYAPDLSIVGEAQKPIRGVVTDAETGKPLAGAEVWLSRSGEAPPAPAAAFRQVRPARPVRNPWRPQSDQVHGRVQERSCLWIHGLPILDR